MSTKKPKKQRHISREVLGSESDPDAVLASLPIGTSDWIRVLGAILKKHNFKHSKKHKGVGFKTMLDRQRFYASFFRELRRHTPYHNVDPRQLANRHIEAVLARWIDRKLATATIHNYLSFLRTYCGWIGKPGMVREPEYYVGADSLHAHRTQVATSDASWDAKNIDIEAKIAEISAIDTWVGLRLELCWAFGMRPKESGHLRPHGAVIGRAQANPRDAAAFPECAEFLRIQHGTKGGRLRDVPLTTDGQRELLARVTAAVAPGMYVGRPGFTSTQNSARFYYVIRKCGIAKKLLGVVAHGLRHQFVNDAYEAETGSPSPVRGGVGRPVGDIEARVRAARLLGHSRTRATTGYIGAQGRGPAAPSQGSTDSQAGDAP